MNKFIFIVNTILDGLHLKGGVHLKWCSVACRYINSKIKRANFIRPFKKIVIRNRHPPLHPLRNPLHTLRFTLYHSCSPSLLSLPSQKILKQRSPLGNYLSPPCNSATPPYPPCNFSPCVATKNISLIVFLCNRYIIIAY